MRLPPRPFASLYPPLLLIGLLAAGCQNSKAFTEGVPRITSRMDADIRHYAAGDPAKLADADAFAAATKDPASVDVAKVEPAWSDVKRWYVPAVEADAKLSADERAVRHDPIDRLDRIIAAERGRPLRRDN